ncbi:PTS ascorbate transporter subunit IIC [Paenibacillus validus]|uniref:PTS ascorbate transporter subunit IIC n=1 Tax=Paenibacillus validus TaxID=44253 RepID=UPI000FD8AEA1|nr:PTS ascorbate transporter subunit IIC [Paenibacillus validus]MED4600117.1 PTS ascorbate transporter subunit IIC [Paenibacillus validus]MED4605564.1 PTS ascorbate transporter subunit IIC [Paenibacillus validus]
MDLTGLLDMDYFWWVFIKMVGFGIIFVVIAVAIASAGHLLEVIINAFRRMSK